MDITEQQVIAPVKAIANPEDRLRALIRLHIGVVLKERDREITVMLHENHPLPAEYRRLINARKKEYVHFVEHLIEDAQKARNSKSRVTPKAAAFALLGMINWIYQWYRSDGPISEAALVDQFTEIIFAGVFGA